MVYAPFSGRNAGVPDSDVTYPSGLLLQTPYPVFFPPFFGVLQKKRMGNSDVINLDAAGARGPWGWGWVGGGCGLVPMCLCPVDGAVDGAALPACAAPASQHAD